MVLPGRAVRGFMPTTLPAASKIGKRVICGTSINRKQRAGPFSPTSLWPRLTASGKCCQTAATWAKSGGTSAGTNLQFCNRSAKLHGMATTAQAASIGSPHGSHADHCHNAALMASGTCCQAAATWARSGGILGRFRPFRPRAERALKGSRPKRVSLYLAKRYAGTPADS